MRVLLMVSTVLLLSACEDPQLGVGARIGPGGVSVAPTISGRSGPASVVVRP